MKRVHKLQYTSPFTFTEVASTVFYLLLFMAVAFTSLAFPFQLIVNLVHFSSWVNTALYLAGTLTLTPVFFWLAFKIMQRIEAIERKAILRQVQRFEEKRQRRTKPLIITKSVRVNEISYN